MTFLVTITSADGLTPRSLSAVQLQNLKWSAQRTAKEGFAGFTATIPADWDESTDITFGDLVEQRYGGNLHYAGFVTGRSRKWDGDTAYLEITGFGIAKDAYALEVPGAYDWSASPLDRAAAWDAVAQDTIAGAMPTLELAYTAIGLIAERLDVQYQVFGDAVDALRSAAEDLCVAGGDRGGTGGAHRLFFRASSASADYIFPIPDTAEVKKTRGLAGGESADGAFSRIRYRGGPPVFPQLYPNGRFDRLTGYGASTSTVTGAVADGLELIANGSAAITSQQWDALAAGSPGKNVLNLTATASDDDSLDVVLQLSGAGTLQLAYLDQPVKLETLWQGTWPKRVLELEWLDANGHRIGATPVQSVIAGASYGTTWTGESHSFTSPGGAYAVCPKVRIRGGVTDGLLGAVSLRDDAADAGEWLDNGSYTTVVVCDDAALVAYGITADAASAKTLYTGGVYRTVTLNDATVCTRAGALANAAVWFNRNGVPLADPAFCRMDDATVYWPGEGVTLTGKQGGRAMNGATFLPVESVTLTRPGQGCDFEQRIQLKRPEITTIADLAAANVATTKQVLAPQLALLSSLSAPSAGGGAGGSGGAAGGGGGGGNIGPSGYRPPFMIPGGATYDPANDGKALNINPYGVVTGIVDGATGGGGGGGSSPGTEGGTNQPGYGCTFRVDPPDADDCFLTGYYDGEAEAAGRVNVRTRGTITGWKLSANAADDITVEVYKSRYVAGNGQDAVDGLYDPQYPSDGLVYITGGNDPTMTGATAATGDTTGWTDINLIEGDVLWFFLSVAGGVAATRAELLLTVTVDTAVL